jgi:aerobic-type carbon monoxide dehydrogenase small subunit (CoxS/CutS family)
MVMSCAALYEQRKAAGQLGSIDELAVREAVAGNLCRCGSYPHVIGATVAAAHGTRPPGGAR